MIEHERARKAAWSHASTPLSSAEEPSSPRMSARHDASRGGALRVVVTCSPLHVWQPVTTAGGNVFKDGQAASTSRSSFRSMAIITR